MNLISRVRVRLRELKDDRAGARGNESASINKYGIDCSDAIKCIQQFKDR